MMSSELDKFKEIIETADSSRYISRADWERYLTTSVPDWRKIVQDPVNWDPIEKILPDKNYDSFCKLFVDSIGIGLAKRWFRSDIEARKDAVRYHWLDDLNNLNASIWKELTDEMKHFVINRVFDRDPGEPFNFLNQIPY
ncbi:MAG: hypothetical protein WCO93_11090, partial [bacterium]